MPLSSAGSTRSCPDASKGPPWHSDCDSPTHGEVAIRSSQYDERVFVLQAIPVWICWGIRGSAVAHRLAEDGVDFGAKEIRERRAVDKRCAEPVPGAEGTHRGRAEAEQPLCTGEVAP